MIYSGKKILGKHLFNEVANSSIKILELIRNPRLPTQKTKYSYGVGSEAAIYSVLLDKCITVLALDEINENNYKSILVTVNDALYKVYQYVLEGEDIYKSKGGDMTERIPFPYLLHSYETEKEDDPDKNKFYLAYYVLCISYLAEYKDFHALSYADLPSFEDPELSSKLYKNSIDALGGLLIAQICSEYGASCLERAVGIINTREKQTVINSMSDLANFGKGKSKIDEINQKNKIDKSKYWAPMIQEVHQIVIDKKISVSSAAIIIGKKHGLPEKGLSENGTCGTLRNRYNKWKTKQP